MSITYEEALATLESMFGEPWTRESLDLVLRHFKGHMENTVESILGHGEGAPDALLEKLKSGKDDDNNAADLDQQLARQLAAQERQGQVAAAAGGAKTKKKKGRGTDITLPPDFLRVPGYKGGAGGGSTGGGGGMDEDEALARMLQDELFSQELANNPEFAHLARPRTAGGRPTGAAQRGRVGEMPTRSAQSGRQFSVGGGSAEEGPKIMEKLTGMGNEAKKRLQIMAAQWGQASARFTQGGGGAAGASQPQASNAATMNETRGLLDDDDGEEMELSFAKTKDQ